VGSYLVEDVANAEFFTHASHKPQMISDLRAVWVRLWRDVRAVRLSHNLLLCRGDYIDTPKLLNYMSVVRNVGITCGQ